MNNRLGFWGSIASIVSLALAFGGGYFLNQQTLRTGDNRISNDSSSNVTVNNPVNVSTQPSSQNQQVQIILQQVISDLPPEKREFAEEIAESVGGVLKASSGTESEMRKAAEDFRKRISEAKLLSYDVVTSPFPLTLKRTVMLCDNSFSVAYQSDTHSGAKFISINGRGSAGIPGNIFKSSNNNKNLELVYMEYLENEKTIIMSYVCS